MATLFQCDKCKRTGRLSDRKGRLIVQELNVHDGLPHASLFNSRAEVCGICFGELTGMMNAIRKPAQFGEAIDIIGEVVRMETETGEASR